MVVDVEGLAARVVPVPVVEGRYHGMRAAKDCLLWYRLPINGMLGDGRAGTDVKPEKPVLERFDLARRKLDVIAEPVSSYAVSGDGTRLVVRDGATLRVLRTDRSGSSAPTDGPVDAGADEYPIDTRRIVVTVDPTAEWHQMFDEAARLMRDHFWVADMAGVDWAAEVARYRPLVDAVGSHDDLADLLWELAGELGTSHAYVMPPGGRGEDGRPGLLGADLEPVDDGWRVARVLPPETSDPAARSPLSGPGVDVRAGDVIVEVGGAAGGPAARARAAARRRGRGSWSSSPSAAAPTRHRGDPPRRRAPPALRGRAALPGLGGRAAGRGRRAFRRAAGLPARARHDAHGLGAAAPRPVAARPPARA